MINYMLELLKQDKELYDLFTKQEEYNSLILDKYQRFHHCLSKHGKILEPEVSKFLIQNGLHREYPDNKKFAVCLTHDIDILYMSNKQMILNMSYDIAKGRIKKGLKVIFNKLNKRRNPLWNFNDIITLENKYQAKSSFYFLVLDKDDLDFNYDIEDLKNVINHIAHIGWEVGLHGGHGAYNNLDRIKKEKSILENILGRKVIGYRNHYLRFKVPDTWELLSKAGFKYDSTFGYIDCVGFRNGMCHPFKPLNYETNEEINILEIPLVIMDRSLFDMMMLDEKGAWDITSKLIDDVEKYNGVMTILWHNTFMLDDNLKFYEKILKYCHKKNAWMTSGEEIFNFYEKNHY